jgi:hypothetical protein
MAQFPAAGFVSDEVRTEGDMKAAFEAWLAATKQIPGAGVTESALTIVSGAITPTSGVHAVDTESGAASDDLATIATTNLPDGSFVWLHPVSSARDVVVKHNAGGAGQISLRAGADLTLGESTSYVLLRRAGADWQELQNLSAAPPALGISTVRGAVGARTSAATYTVSGSTAITFYNPTTGAIERVVRSQGSLTVNAGTQGRNGRDQAGAFTASSCLYLYYTLAPGASPPVALVVSASAPSTGPILANGETSWAFICALRWNASSNFFNTFLRGRRVYYTAPLADTQALSGGASASFASVSYASFLPPQDVSADVRVLAQVVGNTSAAGAFSTNMEFSFDGSAQALYVFQGDDVTAGSVLAGIGTPVHLPNLSQAIFYRKAGLAGGSVYLWVLDYDNANGG